MWLRMRTSECGSKPSGSIKRWEILEGLHNCGRLNHEDISDGPCLEDMLSLKRCIYFIF
jgi:hypothetical protein